MASWMVCSGGAGGMSEKRKKVCLFGEVARSSFVLVFCLLGDYLDVIQYIF